MTKSMPAIVLLSGGIDSTTVLAIALDAGYAPYALSFRYGQRHAYELEAAQRIAQSMGVITHKIIDLDLGAFGGSSLTSNLDLPTGRSIKEMGSGIPSTYVPARNTIFLSFALAWAEVLGANDIFLGVNALDYAGYPDCRPEYIQAFETMANLATRAGVEGQTRLKLHTPLIQWTKAEIIARGTDLGVDYSMTSSCYDPSSDGSACGQCDACLLRLEGFRSAGMQDPIRYREVR